MQRPNLCTDAEVRTLGEWSFLEDFQRKRRHFVDLMKGLFSGARQMRIAQLPTDVDLWNWLELLLESDVIFDKVVKDKLYIRPGRAKIFRSMFARYAVDQTWGEVVR